MAYLAPTETDKKYTAYFSNYGAFLAGWLFYEQVIELLIKRELKLEVRETSIVCSAINFSVKFNMLLALLRRNPKNAAGIGHLNAVQKIASRNKIVHAFLIQPENADGIHLVSRDIKDGRYIVKSKPHDPRLHMEQFLDAFKALQDWSGITDAEIDEYGRDIESASKGHQVQDSSRPEGQPNDRQSTPEHSTIFPQQEDG